TINRQHLMAWNAWTIEALICAADFADARGAGDEAESLATAGLRALESLWDRQVTSDDGDDGDDGDDRVPEVWRVGVAEADPAPAGASPPAPTPGLLEDYASLGLACLSVHERLGDPRWRRRAARIARATLDRFAREGGGFWMEAEPPAGGDGRGGVPRLRTESRSDGATPGGAALAVELLARFEGSALAPGGAAAHLAVTARRFAHAPNEALRFGAMLRALAWMEPGAIHLRVVAAPTRSVDEVS